MIWDARWSRKRDTTWRGYKAHLSESCDPDTPNLIIDVQTTPATDADNATLPAIATSLQARDLAPAEHYLDEGYVTADAVARTQIVEPLTRDTSWQTRAGKGFDRDSFHIDFDTHTATCPGGKTSTAWQPPAVAVSAVAARSWSSRITACTSRCTLTCPASRVIKLNDASTASASPTGDRIIRQAGLHILRLRVGAQPCQHPQHPHRQRGPDGDRVYAGLKDRGDRALR